MKQNARWGREEASQWAEDHGDGDPVERDAGRCKAGEMGLGCDVEGPGVQP